MKYLNSLLAGSLMICAYTAMPARTLNISQGAVTYSFPAATTGEMPFSADGRVLTVQGRDFDTSAISLIDTDEREVVDNLVVVTYSPDGAAVNVAGNIAAYVDVSVDGGYVSVTQSSLVSDDTCGEITYRLSGESADGAFSLSGSFKASVELRGLTLTSARGAALDLQNGKRIAIRVAEGTVNKLADAAGGSQKGCINCKGHLEFKQKGTLEVVGHTAHGIYAKEYIEIKNTRISVTEAVKDGLNCNQYFLMESGELNIAGVGDDGIQTSFKDDTDREAEDTGTITLAGGTLNVAVSARAAKAVKADGDFIMTGGTLTASTSGHGKWSSEDAKTKAAACVSADGTVLISDGVLNLTSTGSGGKGISCDGALTVNGGEITVDTSGGLYVYRNGTEYLDYTGNTDNIASDSKSSPKGIKSDSDIEINGGTLRITATGNGSEGIESKAVLTISGGDIVVRTKDDAINSSSHMYIKGGKVDVISTGNDGLDANGNMYISGGVVTAFGAGAPECGIDVNDEYGYKLYITGGMVLGVGGNNSTPSTSTDSQPYITPSMTVAGPGTLTVSAGSEELYTFDIPADYSGSTSSRPGGFAPGGPGGGRPGSTGGGVLISVPGLTSGTTYTVSSGSTTTTAAAR